MKKYFEKWSNFAISGFMIFLATSCAINQSKYEKEYSKVWKEIIKSNAWQESLLANNENPDSGDFYASTGDDVVVLDESPVASSDFNFEKKYQFLVSRAYFKIITEAEKADARITAEQRLLNDQLVSENGIKEKALIRQKEEMTRKYNAHKAMLQGLKSWNIFSENRSGDLDYFKAENRVAVQQMTENGENDARMVNFLIYKLADLYHVEEN